MNTKFNIGQRVTYPIVTTADGKITGITVGKDGATHYGIGNKFYDESDLTLLIDSDSAEKITPSRFKVGDTVKIINPCNGCLGASGLIGNITSDANNSGLLKTERGINVLTELGVWRVNEDGCEPFAEPDPAPEKPKPVKLYCVKSYKPGEWLTKGGVYELSADDAVAMDDGYVETYGGVFLGSSPFKSYFVPLVKRPAMVGEWVMPTDDWFYARPGLDKKTYKVDRVDCDGDIWILGNNRCVQTGRYGRPQHYLVLDGYHGEQEA